MREIQVIRRFELAFISLAIILHVSWQLFWETTNFASMNLIYVQGAEGYNQALNNFFPVIAGTALLFAAWYIFHYLVYPRLRSGEAREKVWIYLATAIVCTIAGVLLYHYFKLYLHKYITNNVITHVKFNSLYRKMTVFSDIVGILVVIGIYELFAQLYYYLHQQLSGEKESVFRFMSYFFMACIGALLVILAIIVRAPTPLWEGQTSAFLFISGLVILVLILQEFVFCYLLPHIQTPRSAEFLRNMGICLLIGFTGIYILWGCHNQFRSFSIKPTAIYFSVLFASGIIAYLRNIFSREKLVLQTQVSNTSAELSNLRSQINPHFLFNALNSLYASALKENGEKTAEGIQKLGDMMRFMLQENNQERIPLDKETAYLHNYIDIQRIRIDESQGVEIRVNIQEPDRVIYIAPMLLTPFVENAFKHGISLQNPSWIFITLTQDATKLYFKVHNSLHPKQENDPEEEKSGVGLENVKKRLELIYPNRHCLDIQQSETDYFISLTLVYW